MKIGKSLKVLFLLALALLTLSACKPAPKESPEQVIQKFKEVAKDIKAMDGSLVAVMTGTDIQDNIDVNLSVDVKLDRREGVDRKADINLKLEGNLNAGGQALEGKVNLKIRTIGLEFYFNLAELDSSDPSIQSFKPILTPYQGKWLHLASDFIPESIRELQQKDAESLEKERQLKELFVNTNLFEVTKEFGVETFNGQKVHHYGVRLNEDGLNQYIRKAASINGQEMTDLEVQETASIAQNLTNIELWIGTKDYYLYKGVISLTGENLDQGIESAISLTYTANSYNEDPKIEAPADFEEFNPLSLLIGLQLPSPALEGTGPVPDLEGLEGLNLEELEGLLEE